MSAKMEPNPMQKSEENCGGLCVGNGGGDGGWTCGLGGRASQELCQEPSPGTPGHRCVRAHAAEYTYVPRMPRYLPRCSGGTAASASRPARRRPGTRRGVSRMPAEGKLQVTHTAPRTSSTSTLPCIPFPHHGFPLPALPTYAIPRSPCLLPSTPPPPLAPASPTRGEPRHIHLHHHALLQRAHTALAATHRLVAALCVWSGGGGGAVWGWRGAYLWFCRA